MQTLFLSVFGGAFGPSILQSIVLGATDGNSATWGGGCTQSGIIKIAEFCRSGTKNNSILYNLKKGRETNSLRVVAALKSFHYHILVLNLIPISFSYGCGSLPLQHPL